MKCAILVASALALSVPAHAEPSTQFTGNWAMMSDGTACMLTNDFVGRTTMVLYSQGVSRLQVALSNPGWKSLRVDEPYKIELVFDQASIWRIDATGNEDGSGYPGLIFNTPPMPNSAGDSFLGDVAKSKTMNFRRNGRVLVSFDLNGSARAVTAFNKCLRNLPPEDPFQ